MHYLTSTISLEKIKHSQFEPDSITFSNSSENLPHEKECYYAAAIEILALIHRDLLNTKPHPD